MISILFPLHTNFLLKLLEEWDIIVVIKIFLIEWTSDEPSHPVSGDSMDCQV